MAAFDLDLQRLDTNALSMAYAVVPWDSEIFGVRVAQISGLDVRAPREASRVFAGFEEWRDAACVELVSCRLEHQRLRESMLLEAHGFRFVEMVCSPGLGNLQALRFDPDELDLVEATASDVPALEAVAAEAFVTGRYGLDWRLDRSFNGLRYRYWVRSSYANPRHTTLVARIGGEVAGFFIVERTAPERFYWHLTAISPGFQGQGLGKRLWRAMMRRHQGEGADRIETTISLHNTPVLNLYARLGFSFSEPFTTFHWLREHAGAIAGRT